MDFQVDLRRTLEAEPEADREPDHGQETPDLEYC